MKLIRFERGAGFEFALTFEDGERVTVNLEPLIGRYLSPDELATAEIDPDWGCLQFQDGNVDIEPTTLYRYALQSSGASETGASKAAQPAGKNGPGSVAAAAK